MGIQTIGDANKNFGEHPDDIELRIKLTPPHATHIRKIAEASGVPNVPTFVHGLINALCGDRWK